MGITWILLSSSVPPDLQPSCTISYLSQCRGSAGTFNWNSGILQSEEVQWGGVQWGGVQCVQPSNIQQSSVKLSWRGHGAQEAEVQTMGLE